MWRNILLLGMLIGLPLTGYCDTVQFTIDPANIGTLYQGGAVDLFSSGLNGTALAGQSESLNLVFSNGLLARLFLTDPGAFSVELEVYTNATIDPGFAGTTTGYLLDPDGNEFGGSMDAGRADGTNGTFEIGLGQFTSGDLDGQSVVDISGIHFDTIFPDTEFTVSNAELILSLNSDSNEVKFGTPQQLPESSSTLVLTLVSLAALAFAAHCVALKRFPW